jgi:DNA-binding NtrC family response regulator
VRHVNTRIIAATNRSLEDDVQRGVFRHDLFYRLSVVALQVPPLRERPDDVPALAQHFLRRSTAKLRRDVRRFSADALRLLREYEWPGNVRELQNVVEGAVVLASDDEIRVEHLPASMTHRRYAAAHAVRRNELTTVAAVIERFGGNQTQAAAALGVSRTTLWRRLRRTRDAGVPALLMPAGCAGAATDASVGHVDAVFEPPGRCGEARTSDARHVIAAAGRTPAIEPCS